MEAGVRDLRNNLSRYLDAVRRGDEITVTDRGKAVARIVPIGERPLDRLIAEGIVRPAPSQERSVPSRRVKSSKPVTELVAEQRR